MKKNTFYIIAILFVFSVLLTVVNYFWIKNNLYHLSPPWDQSAYIYMTLHEYEVLLNGNIFQFIKLVITQAPNLAPLFPATGIPFVALLGVNVYTAYLVNSIYLFILLLSVFFIADRVGGRKAAALSVFAVATFPAVIAFSRDYLFEFPLDALTALSYLFLLKSESFKNRWASILFGVFSALSILTKTMGVVFFIMPLFYALYVYISASDSKIVRKNIIYAFVSLLVIASIYYLPNFKHIFGYLFYFGLGEGAKNFNVGISDITSLNYWTVYFKHITDRGISPGYLLLFILSMLVYLFKKDKLISKDYLLIWLWLICGYIFLSVPQNKGGERYALPILSAIAIITSVHIMKISWKPLRYLLVVFAIAIGIVNYTYQTDSGGCMYRQFYYKETPILVTTQVSCRMQEEADIPYDRDWEVMPMLRYIDNLNGTGSKTIHVLVAVDHPFLNINSLRLYATLYKLKGEIISNFLFDSVAYKPSDANLIRQLLKENEFIMTKSGYQGPEFSNANNSLAKDLLSNRTPLKNFIMADGSVLSIYAGID